MAEIWLIVFLAFVAFHIVHGNDNENNTLSNDWIETVTEGFPKQSEDDIINYSRKYQAMAIKYIDLLKDPEMFIVKDMGIKGRGVISTEAIPKGSFICEYTGELLTEEEDDKRQEIEALQNKCDTRIYRYIFWCSDKLWVIDSAEETSRVGRLVNHRLKYPNVESVSFEYKGIPRLVFIAKRDIFPYEELTIDYDMTDEYIVDNPWLVN